ncbi:MAG TPA: DUF1572 family protein [Terriglobia bacterium]|nr:DUF1572 family protein [Terriglobia bacterium]
MNKTPSPNPWQPFLKLAEHSLRRHHLPRIERCFDLLSPEQIWWRPNPASNSAGNLALHLAGNVRQWIVSAVGGAPDARQRDQEFAERGPLPDPELVKVLRVSVRDACRVLRRLSAVELARIYTIQGLQVTGLNAIFHVVEHFAFHTGQIIFISKQQLRRDLDFTRLPGDMPEHRTRERASRKLPVI